MVGEIGTLVTGVILLKLSGTGDGDEEGDGGKDVSRERDLLSRSVTHWSSLVRSISTPMMGDGYVKMQKLSYRGTYPNPK